MARNGVNQMEFQHLLNCINSLNDLSNNVEQELSRGADLAVQMSVAKTPVVTGNLRRNTKKVKKARKKYEVKNDVDYAIYAYASNEAKGNDFFYGEIEKANKITQRRIQNVFRRWRGR